MKKPIRISKDVAFPLDAITQKFAIIGMTGSGKTYTASSMIERFLKHNFPVVIIDPTDVWWGLRSSADGKKPGFPVLVMGGRHGDVPLEPTAGATIAEFIVKERVPTILSIADWSDEEQKIFVAAFCKTLFRKNRKPIHVVIDEADEFAPQMPSDKESATCLKIVDRLIRRGRAFGIGSTLITQRVAVLHKSVLSQASTLIVHLLTGRNDRLTAKSWIDTHDTDDENIYDTIPKLRIGEAIVWSPSWLRIKVKTKIDKKLTFDSSATPKLGRRIRAPKKLAKIDLEGITKRIAATIEAKKQEDPRELKRIIDKLRREATLAKIQVGTSALSDNSHKDIRIKIKKIIVEVPALKKRQIRKLEKLAEIFKKQADRLEHWSQNAGVEARGLSRELASVLEEIKNPKHIAEIAAPENTPSTKPLPPPSRIMKEGSEGLALSTRKAQKELEATTEGEAPPSGGPLRILGALYLTARPMSKVEVGIWTVNSHTGGTFGTYLSRLKAGDWIFVPDENFSMTEKGAAWIQTHLDRLDSLKLPTTAEALLAAWEQSLRGSLSKILQAVVQHGPLTREEIGVAIQNKHTGGTFGTYLSRLRKRGLIEFRGGKFHAYKGFSQ